MIDYVLKADGAWFTVEPADGKEYTLREVQEIVGGYIEVLRFTEYHWLVLDEEGKLKNLPYNPIATLMCHILECIDKNDWIVGDVLVCQRSHIT
ncbi:MAG: DUF3846 domain-containing protein [Ktedonobacteraceae bacterium]